MGIVDHGYNHTAIIDANAERSFGCIPIVFRPPPVRILLIQLKSLTKTYWTFPKGHAKDNETQKQSAIRNLYEETGLKIMERHMLTDKGVQSQNTTPESDAPRNVTLWPVMIKDQDSKNVKIYEAEIWKHEWLTVSDAFERLEYDDDRAMLQEMIETRFGGEL